MLLSRGSLDFGGNNTSAKRKRIGVDSEDDVVCTTGLQGSIRKRRVFQPRDRIVSMSAEATRDANCANSSEAQAEAEGFSAVVFSKITALAFAVWRASARYDSALDFSPPKSPRWASYDFCAQSLLHILGSLRILKQRREFGDVDRIDPQCLCHCTECIDDTQLHHQSSFFILLPEDDDFCQPWSGEARRARPDSPDCVLHQAVRSQGS